MIPGLFGVDIISELDRLLERHYELIIPAPVKKELEKLATDGGPEERSAARLGLTVAARGKVVACADQADEAILRLADKGGYAVGTTDAALRRELRRRGVPVIYLRGKSRLEISGQVR
jgi:rRNA-processing protein FCF1